MDCKKNKHSNLKIKIVNFVIALALLLSGCAVPFQNAETLEKGESEAIIGYSPITNLSIRYDKALDGFTDIGFGLDLNIPFMIHSLGFVSGKRKLISFDLSNDNRLNLLISGSAGVLLAEDECPGYYQANGMIGFGKRATFLTIGGGLLKDPRYTYDYMHNSFSDEVLRHMFFGLKVKHFMIQMQFIFRGEYADEIANFGIAYCN